MRKSTFLFKLFSAALCFFMIHTTAFSAVEFSVKFISIDATQMGDDVQIRWVTDSEFNSELFKVQRLVNGANGWEDIGIVMSNATIPQSSSYEFMDENPVAGMTHYRLKQKDFDGQITYSKKIQLNVSLFTEEDMEEQVLVYPNPAINEVLIEGPVISETSEVQMMDVTGRLIAIEIYIQDQQIQVRPIEKVTGLYFITIFDPYRSIAKKIRFK